MCNKPCRRYSPVGKDRRGAILVLSAILMVVMCACIAVAVDVGYVAVCKTEFQRTLDAGALAGAATIVDGSSAAEESVREFIRLNPVSGHTIEGLDVTIDRGHWNPATKAFQSSNSLPSAIKVEARVNDLRYFFGQMFQRYSFDLDGEAIAMFQPREIAVVLDYSGSMNDDSELRSMSALGRTPVETNLRQIYDELGAPTYGGMQWTPVYISSSRRSTVRNALGLNGVSYPYPSGSWDDYISYVMNDWYIRNAGYRKRYGYLTLVNYWLQKRPKYSQTPDLWKTSEQPITAVKDALKLYLAFLQEVDTDDRVALVVYTHPSGGAKLETQLTSDFQLVEDISRQRQAGHYDTMTNIYAGLKKAREELEDHARLGAFKLIVLMTDGFANEPGSTSYARNKVLSEAAKCAANGYPVITVSLGSNADTALMQTVADTTSGQHFNIPGGRTVDEYEDELRDVFRAIADHRPLKIVK